RSALIAQVVHWTGGHPYLTQRLCYEVAKAEATTSQQVDQLCRETFLDRKARETDPNLHFAHERILKDPENDPGELLRLYATVRKGTPVRYNPTNSLANTLRVSGLVAVLESQLQVRNRIYAEQFTSTWVQESLRSLPDVARRKAYWQGFRRAALLGCILLLSTSAAIWFGVKAKQENREKTQLAKKNDQQTKLLLKGKEELLTITRQLSNRTGEVAGKTKELSAKIGELTQKSQELQMRKQAVEDLKKAQGVTAVALAQAQSNLTQAQRKVNQVRAQVTRLQASARSAVLKVEQLGQDEFKIAARTPGQEKRALTLGIRTISSLLESGITPKDETLENLSRVVNRGLVRLAHLRHDWRVTCVALSPDGKMAVTAGFSNEIWVWDVATGQCVQKITGFPNKLRPNEQYCTVIFSPSGDQVLTGAQDGVLRLWEVRGGRLSKKPLEHTVQELANGELGTMLFALFSPSGKEIATTARLANGRYTVLVIDA
ncbi:hypothetical protein, partial [Armatimonas sp.]|uniref:WD40 repeat domain-containing protein n=1 Tax=Armatimonas sp. TaxID=1872638 RepID=UPI00286A98B0